MQIGDGHEDSTHTETDGRCARLRAGIHSNGDNSRGAGKTIRQTRECTFSGWISGKRICRAAEKRAYLPTSSAGLYLGAAGHQHVGNERGFREGVWRWL